MALLDADVNLRVVRRFVNATIEEAKGEKVLRAVDPGQQFVKIVHDRMVALLGDTKTDLRLKGPDTQSVILFLGLQGSGKTTSGRSSPPAFKRAGKPCSPPATWSAPPPSNSFRYSEKTGVAVYREDTKDAVKVAKNALAFAKKNGHDVLIVDTAGRLQIDEAMMDEIGRIRKRLILWKPFWSRTP